MCFYCFDWCTQQSGGSSLKGNRRRHLVSVRQDRQSRVDVRNTLSWRHSNFSNLVHLWYSLKQERRLRIRSLLENSLFFAGYSVPLIKLIYFCEESRSATATHYNTFHYNTPQHTATHCIELLHTEHSETLSQCIQWVQAHDFYRESRSTTFPESRSAIAKHNKAFQHTAAH